MSIEIVSWKNQPNPVYDYIANLRSPASRRVIAIALRNMILLVTEEDGGIAPDAIFHFPWWELRKKHVNILRSRLIENYSFATVNQHLSALRGVLKSCWEAGLMDQDAYMRAVSVENERGEVEPAGRDISAAELRQLLLSCYEDGKKGVRDLAILAVLATCGLRRAELSALDLEHLYLNTGALLVHGKGQKERTVYILNEARVALDNWLALRGDAPGSLFYRFRKGDVMIAKRLSAQSVYNMIEERASRLGLERLTPHDFRRTLVGNLLDIGVDAVTVANITGHSSMDMVKRYDRRKDRAKKTAQDKLHLPI